MLTFRFLGDEMGSIVSSVGCLFITFWGLRTLVHWFYPNPRCAAIGFPGQHYDDPFYSPVIDDISYGY